MRLVGRSSGSSPNSSLNLFLLLTSIFFSLGSRRWTKVWTTCKALSRKGTTISTCPRAKSVHGNLRVGRCHLTHSFKCTPLPIHESHWMQVQCIWHPDIYLRLKNVTFGLVRPWSRASSSAISPTLRLALWVSTLELAFSTWLRTWRQ